MNRTRTKAFWEKVDIQGPDECWNWVASKTPRGYGRQTIRGRSETGEIASRIAWVLSEGKDIPQGLEVCHKCDNPSCVNRLHLFLGTHLENMIDAKNKGTMKVKSKGKIGSKNLSAKLHETDIPLIRNLLSDCVPKSKIARMYKVDRGVITSIQKRENWTHV